MAQIHRRDGRHKGSSMITQTWFSVTSFIAAFAAIGLSSLLFAKGRPISLNRAVASVLVATAVVHFANGLALMDTGRVLFWRHLGLTGELLQAAVILYVGVAIFKATAPGFEQGVRWRARAVLLLSVLLGILALFQGAFGMADSGSASLWMNMSALGRVMYVFILLVMALGLTQLEQILRGISDPLRYQLKFVLIGVGALAAYQVYQASRLLLLPVWRPDHVAIGGLTTLIALGLIGLRSWPWKPTSHRGPFKRLSRSASSSRPVCSEPTTISSASRSSPRIGGWSNR